MADSPIHNVTVRNWLARANSVVAGLMFAQGVFWALRGEAVWAVMFGFCCGLNVLSAWLWFARKR